MASEFIGERRAFGRAVREVREERGLSQMALGELAGLHFNYIGGIERAERNPTFTTLVKLASALGMRPSELIARSETPQDE